MPLKVRATTGISLYALFQGTNIAVAGVEGTSLDLGWYTFSDVAIDAAGLPSGTYVGAFLEGSAASPSAGDPEHGTFTNFVWDGNEEVPLLTTEDIQGALAVSQARPQLR